MKKLLFVLTFALAGSTLLAAGGSNRGRVRPMAGNDDGPATTGKAAKFLIDQMPRTGQSTLMNAPGLNGASMVSPCYKKPRQWIVCETKYTTYGTDKSNFLDQLTFTWHVLLETKTAKENKGNREKLAPYSYFTTSITYYNIPKGTHASSVVLPPSYLERYGEPKVIGFVVTNENGDELGGGTVSENQYIKPNTKFWDNPDIMDAKDPKTGGAMVERRQGLLDRSKTIWGLVFPNDYETTLQ